MSTTLRRSSTYGSNKSSWCVVCGLERAFEHHALHAGIAVAQQLVGAVLDPAVTSVSAGPPLVGLYLKPPSSGGLCDGVMTMPSARCSRAAAVVTQNRARDHRRRRNPSSRWMTVCTPLAASTSSAVRCAGPDSACVSLPM